MPLGPQQLDGPPPSPVSDPSAASATSRLGMLTGGAAPGQPGGPGGAGGPGAAPMGQPDMSGVMALGQKVQEAILALAQMLPAQAGSLNQAVELIVNAVAQAAQSNPGEGNGKPPSPPVTQAGPQFAGGGFGAGRAS